MRTLQPSFEVQYEEAVRALDRGIETRRRGRIGLGPYGDRGWVYAPADSSAETVRELLALYVRLIEARGAERAAAATELTAWLLLHAEAAANEKAARLHNDKHHGGESSWEYAKVYRPSWWRRFGDHTWGPPGMKWTPRLRRGSEANPG
jgi:hypothetical protein